MNSPRFAPILAALLAVVLLCGVGHGAERRIDFELDVNRSTCTFPRTLQIIARRLELPIGVEIRAGDCQMGRAIPSSGASVRLTGLTLHEALRALETLDPRYSWRDNAGLIVLRPADAWDDPSNVLNRVVAAQLPTPSTAFDALVAVLRPLGSRLTGIDAAGVQSQDLSRPFVAAVPDEPSVLMLLNATVRAHTRLRWIVQHCSGGKPGDVHLQLQAFDGPSIASAVSSRGSNPLLRCAI